jgi:hypothetical protein
VDRFMMWPLVSSLFGNNLRVVVPPRRVK